MTVRPGGGAGIRRLAAPNMKKLAKDLLVLSPVNLVLREVARRLPLTPTLARLPVSLDEVRGQVSGVDYRMVAPERCLVAKEIFWGGGARLAPRERIALSLFADLSRRAGTVLDIGSSSGLFSVVAALANPAAQVHAFEIVPEAFELLFRNTVRNDVASRVECHFFGLGRDGAVIRMGDTRGESSVPTSMSSSVSAAADEPGTNVGYRSLDTFVERLPPGQGDAWKIDVEGTEDDLFAEGWRAIDARRPWILCEILTSSRDPAAIDEGLRARGYRLYNVTDDGLVPHDSLRPIAGSYDWLFAPQALETLPSWRPISVQSR